MENAEERRNGFSGMLLLSGNNFDFKKLDNDLKENWGIDIELDQQDLEKGIVVTNSGGCYVNLMFLDVAVPNDEAVEASRKNFAWRDAEEAAKAHKSHLMVFVFGGSNPYETGKLYSKVMGECCNQAEALGVYQHGTVFHPKAFRDISHLMKQHLDSVPYYNLVYVGMYRSMRGVCGYTRGLNQLGKDEIEIIDSKKNPKDVYEFLDNIVQYVVFNNVTLKDGETIGGSAEERMLITRSEGVEKEGMSLKIKF